MNFTAIMICLTLFVGLPWVILHYVTRWKQAPKITEEDEKMLDEMHILARRLEARLETVERIVAADHPDFSTGLNAPGDYRPSLAKPTPDYRSAGRN